MVLPCNRLGANLGRGPLRLLLSNTTSTDLERC
jgi:hypothetical protein